MIVNRYKFHYGPYIMRYQRTPYRKYPQAAIQLLGPLPNALYTRPIVTR